MAEPQHGGELESWCGPAVALPTRPPSVLYYWVNKEQLEILTEHESVKFSNNVMFAGAGICVTLVVTTIILGTSDSKFVWFLAFSIATAAITIITGLFARAGGERTSRVLDEIKSQHKD